MTTTTTHQPSIDDAVEPPPSTRPSGRRGRGKQVAQEAPKAAAVNLLSAWVREENKVRSLRLRFTGGAVAVVALLALVWAGLQMSIATAQRDLSDQEASAGLVRAQIAEMAPLKTYAASIRGRENLVLTSMSSAVTFSRALTSLEAILPPDTSIGTFAGTLTPVDPSTSAPVTGEATTCPGPDPFGVTIVVACVELSGLAPSREAVGNLVVALGRDKQFVEPFITTTTTDDANVVAFSGSFALDPRLLRSAPESEDPAPSGTTTPAAATEETP